MSDLRCSSCGRLATASQAAGERCRARLGSGDACAGTLMAPFVLQCVACGAETVCLVTPSDPSVVLRCPVCWGRLATT